MLGAERGHHPLGRRLTSGERVDQLFDGLRLLREELAVLGHEVGELVGGVLVARVRGQQGVEVGQHVLDPLHRLRIRRLQRLLHPGELRVEHLALQHLLDRLEDLLRLVGPPRVLVEGAYGAGHVVGNGVQLQLGEPGVVALGAGQGLALGGHRLVERRAHLVERAAEVTAPPGGRPQLADLVGEPVEPAAAVDAASHQVAQRVAEVSGGQDVVADLVHGRPDVVRRGEWIRTTPPRPVAEASVIAAVVIGLVALAAHDVRPDYSGPSGQPTACWRLFSR